MSNQEDDDAVDWASGDDFPEEGAELGDDGDWGDFEEADDEGADDHSVDGDTNVFVQVDNLFYEAEDNRRKDPAAALEQFERCVQIEKDDGTRFSKRLRATEHIVGLNLVLGRYDQMMQRFVDLMHLANDPQVTSNDRSQAINAILAAVSEVGNAELIARVYSVALKELKQLGNQEKLYFSIAARLCRSELLHGNLIHAEYILSELHSSCQLPDETDDPRKGAELLEIYALKVQLLESQKDVVKLKELFIRTRDLSAEIRDPRSMSVIQECWGKSYASDGLWENAYTEFWDAFLQFQQIGSERAKTCLKYVVLAAMLSSRQLNPFDATEAKAYQRDAEIEALMALREAYDSSDIDRFIIILESNRAIFASEPFMAKNIEPLLREIRCKSLLRVIAPYDRIHLHILGETLRVSNEQVQDLLVQLILDGKILGRIDQVDGYLELGSLPGVDDAKYKAISQWAHQLDRVCDDLATGISV